MANNSKHIPYQNIPYGTSSQGQVVKLIHFLEKYLADFSPIKSTKTNNEEEVSQMLYKYLQRKQKFNDENYEYPFQFQTETIQKEKGAGGRARKADIGVRVNTFDVDMDLIYCIEAKRLPTIGKGREKEYVIGNSGGINRFKINAHGMTDEGDVIPQNGMVAYVEKLGFPHWFLEINKWINDDTDWGTGELLSKIYFNSKFAKLESVHIRKGGTSVKLTHFWIVV